MTNPKKLIKFMLLTRFLGLFRRIVVGFILIVILLIGYCVWTPPSSLPVQSKPQSNLNNSASTNDLNALKVAGDNCYAAVSTDDLDSKEKYNAAANSTNILVDSIILAINTKGSVESNMRRIRTSISKTNTIISDLNCANTTSFFNTQIKLNEQPFLALIENAREQSANETQTLIKGLQEKKWRIMP